MEKRFLSTVQLNDAGYLNNLIVFKRLGIPFSMSKNLVSLPLGQKMDVSENSIEIKSKETTDELIAFAKHYEIDITITVKKLSK